MMFKFDSILSDAYDKCLKKMYSIGSSGSETGGEITTDIAMNSNFIPNFASAPTPFTSSINTSESRVKDCER